MATQHRFDILTSSGEGRIIRLRDMEGGQQMNSWKCSNGF